MNALQKDIQRKLTKDLLDLIVLELLQNKPMHGYEIITTIRRNYGVSIGSSTLYPLLSDLQKKNLVHHEWNLTNGRARKTFRLTTQGKIILDCTASSFKAICRIMDTEKIHTRDPTKRLELNLGQSHHKETQMLSQNNM